MINGHMLAVGFISGANMLYNKRKEVDALNVFPVPDGDTGTNMSMTCAALAKALGEIQSDSVTKICDTMSYAALRGARGNSGVILSQYFRGISRALKGKSECSEAEFAAALKCGSDAAYAAVMNPTEGTILTVGRVAAEGAVKAAEENADFSGVIEAAVREGRAALEKTPEQLPALKNAGVVDAGGQGWIYLLEGVYAALCGNPVEREDGQEAEPETKTAQGSIDTDNIKFSYCTEFIVEKSNPDVNVIGFKQSIENKGDCMLVIDDEDIVKVHIHTNNPGFVLERAVLLGSLINIKIDNMKYQHESIISAEEDKKIEPRGEKKKYGFVAVAAGDGFEAILKDLGVDRVILGGQTMNPSTDDILNAINEVNAETVFVFPNNKNIIMAATQAAEICEKNVIVIATRTVPECIGAMIEFDAEADAEEIEANMTEAAKRIKTAQVTFAVRDTTADGKEIHEGDIIGVCGSHIDVVGSDKNEVLAELCDGIYDDDEFITVYYGEDTTAEEAEHIGEVLEEKYPDAEVSVRFGGQPLYYYIISAE